MLRKIQRVGKRATKFQYTATYQSVVVECTPKDKWRPNSICVSWTRRGRRIITKLRPWQPSPDNRARGVVIWPDQEVMEIVVTLYKGPKDQSYESKEWDFAVIDVDATGKRKVLASIPINVVRYVSSLPFDHDLHLRLKPVSRKIKAVILDVSITSEFLKEGKATDEDMMSIASMLSVSNLSTIGFLEDDEDDDYTYMGVGVRSISPPDVPENILSTDELLKWAQELTRDLPDVKITNMTTSWRNGLGFLAIIHHFRPDLLPDFNVQSPNAIKENNRTAFTIARSLGIACPLTPNMMVTTTIPDKLSVTSFVYQMYQFFTKARMSAIAKGEKENAGSLEGRRSRGTSPSSPFDMSKFDMFTKDLSPTTSPTGRNDRVMLYSRHSREDLHKDVRSPSPTRETIKIEAREGHVFQPRVDSNLLQAKQNPTLATSREYADGVGEGGGDSKLDQVAGEHAQLGSVDKESAGQTKSNRDLDREVEFENMNTGSEESSQAEGSTTSLLEDKSTSELPSDIKPQETTTTSASESSTIVTPYKYKPGKDMDSIKKATSASVATDDSSTTIGDSSSTAGKGRKLPTVPMSTSSPKVSDKKEERKRLAQEMLKKHKLDKYKMPQNVSLDSLSDSSSSSKYRQEAISLISEALGTPAKTKKEAKKADPDKSSDSSDDLVSRLEESAASLGGSKNSSSPQTTQNNKMTKEVKSDSKLAGRDKERKVRKLPLISSTGGEAVKTERTGNASSKGKANTSAQNGKSPEREISREERTSDFTKEVNLTGAGESPLRTSSNPTDKDGGHSGPKHPIREQRPSMDTTSIPDDSDLPPALPPRCNTTGSLDLQKPAAKKKESKSSVEKKKKVMPRPIPSRPSQILQRMLDEEEKEKERLVEEMEEKKRQQALKEAEEQRLQAEKDAEQREKEEKLIVEQDNRKEEEEMDNVLAQEEIEAGDQISPMKESKAGLATTPKKGLPSPSAWSQHSDDLFKDLLVSQSDYVKTELKSLQRDVQDLESRAQDIEVNIREYMSNGDKEGEEELMQEWFGLLNKKNELIKRQIQLNMIEKEEDLEKRQFLLNRELRPLMEIPEEEKSVEQNERADHLLKELLELIDERDRLEKRKMDSLRVKDYEKETLAPVQAMPEVHPNSSQASGRQGSKDCVIS